MAPDRQRIQQYLKAFDFRTLSIEEEAQLGTTVVAARVRQALDTERVTKKFYDRFQKEHASFLKLVAQIERFKDIEPLPDIDFNIRAGKMLSCKRSRPRRPNNSRTGEEKRYKAALPSPAPALLILPSAKPSSGSLSPGSPGNLVSPVSTCEKPASFISAG